MESLCGTCAFLCCAAIVTEALDRPVSSVPAHRAGSTRENRMEVSDAGETRDGNALLELREEGRGGFGGGEAEAERSWAEGPALSLGTPKTTTPRKTGASVGIAQRTTARTAGRVGSILMPRTLRLRLPRDPRR